MDDASESDHVEVIEKTRAACPVILTCEHASQRMPPPFEWADQDAWLVGTHWAYDLGAAELTRELAAELGAGAVLSRFSRLLIDPNRSESAPDLFRKLAEGRPVALNQDVGEEERARRFAMSHAYHAAIDRALVNDPAALILSIHSFTPVYEGTPRAVELGVLFDDETELATALHAAFVDAGVAALLNEPYSGKFGLMYSVDRHARRHSRRALELELRQDLATEPTSRARIIMVLAATLERLLAP
ncbi:MAG TPA: N-formylglutamate amidohydrolase [Polyangiaceae bacterium]|jgi:predicted N-formylglutamate amidohydrolase|nr:N-formylglutamate amidohydrolase [Polyangiaceae bacterium]